VGGELSQLHLSHGPKNLIVGKKNKRKFDLAYIYKNIKEIFIYTPAKPQMKDSCEL
jgi:hypothetical protein